MEFNNKKIFESTPDNFRASKIRYLDQLEKFITDKQAECKAYRDKAVSPEKMYADRESFVRAYEDMIGLYKPEVSGIPAHTQEKIGEDDFGTIYKISLEATSDLRFHGLLIVPHGLTAPAPLIIAQHGGGGTPELCNDFVGDNNYTHFTKYALERKMIVFSPELLLWRFRIATGEVFPPYPGLDFERDKFDGRLQKVGLSITGLEVFFIKRSIDLLESFDIVDANKIGMTGLSYGGFYSLYTAAVEPRIKVVYSAAVFSDRDNFALPSWRWKNSSLLFHDAEVCGLVAPRPLFIDVGRDDQVFDGTKSEPEAARAKKYYTYLGKEENFYYNLWDGGHRFDIAGGTIHRFLDAVAEQ